MADLAVDRTRGTGIDWSAAVWAGLIGGLAFMMLEMIMAPMFTGAPSIWAPPRLIGAIVLGRSALPPPATFDAGIFLAAMAVHFVLSVLFAIILAVVVARMGSGVALLVGAVFGLVLYLVNFYLFTGIFPWFAGARNWVTIFSHIVFGVVTAWAYTALASRRTRRVAV